jgi:hypothetical protein
MKASDLPSGLGSGSDPSRSLRHARASASHSWIQKRSGFSGSGTENTTRLESGSQCGRTFSAEK